MASRRSWLLPAMVAMALLLGPGLLPVLAHGGSHWAGAYTTSRYDGVYGWIEVTNPNTRPGLFDYVANRVAMRSSAGSPGSAPTHAISVGWAELGWNTVSNPPEQWVYVQDTTHPFQWHLYDSLCVSPGCHVDVRIVKASSCDIGDPTCIFTAQVFNHGTGTWQNLHSVTLGMDRGYLEEFTIASVDPAFPLPNHMAVDISNNDLDWFETNRRFADGSWNLWVSTATSTSVVSPYCSDWINLNYRFETQLGGC